MKKIIFNIIFLLGIVVIGISQPKLNLEVGATYVIEELSESYSYDDFEKVDESGIAEKQILRFYFRVEELKNEVYTLNVTLNYKLNSFVNGAGDFKTYYSNYESCNLLEEPLNPKIFEYKIKVSTNGTVDFGEYIKNELLYVLQKGEKELSSRHPEIGFRFAEAYNYIIRPIQLLSVSFSVNGNIDLYKYFKELTGFNKSGYQFKNQSEQYFSDMSYFAGTGWPKNISLKQNDRSTKIIYGYKRIDIGPASILLIPRDSIPRIKSLQFNKKTHHSDNGKFFLEYPAGKPRIKEILFEYGTYYEEQYLLVGQKITDTLFYTKDKGRIIFNSIQPDLEEQILQNTSAIFSNEMFSSEFRHRCGSLKCESLFIKGQMEQQYDFVDQHKSSIDFRFAAILRELIQAFWSEVLFRNIGFKDYNFSYPELIQSLLHTPLVYSDNLEKEKYFNFIRRFLSNLNFINKRTFFLFSRL